LLTGVTTINIFWLQQIVKFVHIICNTLTILLFYSHVGAEAERRGQGHLSL